MLQSAISCAPPGQRPVRQEVDLPFGRNGCREEPSGAGNSVQVVARQGGDTDDCPDLQTNQSGQRRDADHQL